MGLLQTLLDRIGWLPKPDIVHPYFGPMNFEPELPGFPSYWECWELKPTKQGGISVLVNGGSSGPTDTQVEFFEHVCSSIERIQADLAPFLEERYYSTWARHLNHRTPLTWCGVTIPQNGDPNSQWELNFETNDRSGHMLTVSFENGKPVDASVDG